MITIAGRKAVTIPVVLQVPAFDGCSCNSDERNRLLDVRVIIVIRDISRRSSPNLGPRFIPRGNPTPKSFWERHARISNEQVYFVRPIESELSVRRDGVGLRRFYLLCVCKFLMLAVRRNVILPECRFSDALLNTFL